MERAGTLRAPVLRVSLLRTVLAALAVIGFSIVTVAPNAAAATSPTTASVISSEKNDKLGTILVAGNTVYTLKPSKTACDAKCLKTWVPVVLPQGVTAPTAGAGVDSSKLGTKATTDGSLQITYDAKPLYWFLKDKSPRDVRGNVTDKWGKWAAVVTKASKDGGDSTAGTGGVSF